MKDRSELYAELGELSSEDSYKELGKWLLENRGSLAAALAPAPIDDNRVVEIRKRVYGAGAGTEDAVYLVSLVSAQAGRERTLRAALEELKSAANDANDAMGTWFSAEYNSHPMHLRLDRALMAAYSALASGRGEGETESEVRREG